MLGDKLLMTNRDKYARTIDRLTAYISHHTTDDVNLVLRYEPKHLPKHCSTIFTLFTAVCHFSDIDMIIDNWLDSEYKPDTTKITKVSNKYDVNGSHLRLTKQLECNTLWDARDIEFQLFKEEYSTKPTFDRVQVICKHPKKVITYPLRKEFNKYYFVTR